MSVYPITLSIKQESDVNMDEKERERRWKEMVDNGRRRSWKKELVNDLKLLVMVELVGCGLFVLVELLKY